MSGFFDLPKIRKRLGGNGIAVTMGTVERTGPGRMRALNFVARLHRLDPESPHLEKPPGGSLGGLNSLEWI